MSGTYITTPIGGFCPRCGEGVGTWHPKPQCDAFYDIAYKAARASKRATAPKIEVQYGVRYGDGEIDGPLKRDEAEHLIRQAREQIEADHEVADDYEPMTLLTRTQMVLTSPWTEPTPASPTGQESA